MAEKFDVIVVGAGPSGNAAALRLAEAGLSVLQIERGESPGSKNVQGAILYSAVSYTHLDVYKRQAHVQIASRFLMLLVNRFLASLSFAWRRAVLLGIPCH